MKNNVIRGTTLGLASILFFISSVFMVSATLTDGLVAYYPFDGNADDSSGNGNDGTVYGATLTTDRNNNSNSAYDFDGSNDHILVADDDLLDLIGEYSYGFWVYPESFGNHYTGLLLYGMATQDYAHYGMSFDTGGELVLWSGGGSRTDIKSNYQLGLNNWSHILVTHEGSGINETKLFVNGEHVESFTMSNATASSSDPVIYIGDWWSSHYFDGKIDDIRIWNRSLSQTEVSNEYSGDNCPIENGEVVNRSITFEENTVCNLPDGFSIIGDNINMTCNNALFNSDGELLINVTGSSNFNNCIFDIPSTTIDGTGNITFYYSNFSGIDMYIPCGDSCYFLNSTLSIIHLIGDWFVVDGGFIHVNIPPESFKVWNITLPQREYGWESGITFNNVPSYIENISLNCNGGIINGSRLANSTGIYINTTVDVTIKNCIIQNYDTNVYFENFDGDSFLDNILRYPVTRNAYINSAAGATFSRVDFLN